MSFLTMPREASSKQKALLRFVGVPFREPLSSVDASRLIDEVIESDAYRKQLNEWNKAKLKLYPTLFADELAADKADRADSIYYEVTDETMSALLNRVTKAEVNKVVAYLDEHSPGWDSDPVKRVYDYFLPALQRQFPKRVKRGYVFESPSSKPAGKSASGGCLFVLGTLAICPLVAYFAFLN